MPNPTDSRRSPGARVLAILLIAYVFNFIDRQIIGVLAVPIKAQLDLSDRQLGLMGGSPSRSSIPGSPSRSPGSPTGAAA